MSSTTETRLPAPSSVNLRSFAAAARARFAPVALIVALLVIAAALYSFVQAERYEASSLVLLEPLPAVSEAIAPAALDVTTETGLVKSEVVASEVVNELGLSEQSHELLERVTVSAAVGSKLLEITFAHTDPEVAARGADAFANEYLVLRRGAAASNLETVAETIQAQIALNGRLLDQNQSDISKAKGLALNSQTRQEMKINLALLKPLLEERSELRETVAELQSQLEAIDPTRLLSLGVGTVITPEMPVVERVSPRPLRNVILAAILGIAIAAAWILISLSLKAAPVTP